MIEDITANPTKDRRITKRIHKLELVVSQLLFSESFVEDIMSMSQLQNFAFSLVNKAFDPLEAFNFVLSIFEPQIKNKKVALVFNVVQGL